ncbi:MAG: disulfide bond formation protein B [Halobacteriovoraceae bacterium]|nr:disulfide bond formation protein B [Halobacteriovoraceae bacterium]
MNRLFVIVMVGAMVVLGVSYGTEVMGVKPCTLCKLQRIPYVLFAVNGFLGLMMPIKRGIVRVLQMCFLGGIVLGGIHLGVMMGKVKLPCLRETVGSVEEFRRGLEKKGCGETWRVLGIPGALWNVGICLGGLVLTKKYGARRFLRQKAQSTIN